MSWKGFFTMKLLRPIFLASFIYIIFNSCLKEKEKSSDVYFSSEKFIDSLNLGEKRITKIAIENFRNDKREDNIVVLNFYRQDSIWDYKKQKNVGKTWKSMQKFYFDKDGLTGINAEISDFNGDGFKDLMYQSGIAGRGGNTIRKLFIYDPKSKEFIYIKNSDHYPNLSYNSDLKCINSLILTGSTITSFLKIKSDSLDEFARVDVADTIVVKEKDSSGKFRVIEKRKFTGNDDDFYKTFRRYKPLEY